MISKKMLLLGSHATRLARTHAGTNSGKVLVFRPQSGAVPEVDILLSKMPGPRRLAPFRGRVAYPSYVDESLFGNPHEGAVRMARSMPDASAFPTVLGAAEYGTMEVRARATGRELNEKQQDKARLHALSNARKSKWPNTLEANRCLLYTSPSPRD